MQNEEIYYKQKMRYLYLTLILFGLSFFGCNKAERRSKLTADENSRNTETIRTLKQMMFSYEHKLEECEIDSINSIIALFREKDIDKISDKIYFPLYREYPVPPIKNKEEFRQRFNEIFDKTLIDKIVNSDIDQWSEVGWRGIMLDNGVLWMGNSDGVITAVNYQSSFEKKLREELIAKDKETLHISLKAFEDPIYKIKTKNYLIRIDQLANEKYRYASWKVNEEEFSEPDLILNDGELDFLGSGGGNVITFINYNYTYKVYCNEIGAVDLSDITLEIEKNGRIILSEEGTLVR